MELSFFTRGTSSLQKLIIANNGIDISSYGAVMSPGVRH